jgi:hypothetical protein
MANVGALIPTPTGLGTVVQVLPGHVDPTLSQVVTLPIGGDGTDVLPPDYFGTPLPGQAQSVASFVQTLILPSDSGSSDSFDSGAGTTMAAPPMSQAPATTTSGTSWSTSDNSTAGTGESDSRNSVGTRNSAAPQSSPAVVQAVGAYQATQQRAASDNAQRSVMIG